MENDDILDPVDTTTETGIEEVNVPEQVQEVKEEPKQEPVETFTQEQLDKIVEGRIGRVKKSYEKKYSKLMDTLKAGLGTKDLEDTTNKVAEFYKEQGVNIPQETYDNYSDDDERVLANYDADSIIELGYNEIANTITDLNTRGNLSTREKYMLDRLSNKKKELETEVQLKSIGVDTSILGSKEFKDFAKKFNQDTPIKDIYEIYSQTLPKEEAEPIGSMESTTNKEIKTYYSPEDFDKLTEEDLNNPQIMEAVDKSRVKWFK